MISIHGSFYDRVDFLCSFNGYPINSVGSFTNFSPEHIHLYGGLEAIISEIQYRPLY